MRCMIAALTYPLALMAGVANPQAEQSMAETAVSDEDARLGLGSEQRLTDGLTIIPVAIVEDSRCPADVLCIQAGELIVQVLIRRDGEERQHTLKLGSSALVPGGVVTFSEASERRVDSEGADRFLFTYAPSTAF